MKLLFNHNLSPRLIHLLAELYPNSQHVFYSVWIKPTIDKSGTTQPKMILLLSLEILTTTISASS